VPYAIDFMNPAPYADIHSVGEDNFHWIVDEVAKLAVRKAREHTGQSPEYRWSAFLAGSSAQPETETASKAAQAIKAPKSVSKG